MKKIIFLGCIMLFFASMVFVSYAAMQKEPITRNNLSDLKGKWEGWRTLAQGSVNLRTEMDISNDTLPIKGALTFHDVQRRGMTTGDFTQQITGTINDKGNFCFKWGQNEFELSLYKGDGKMRLEGDFYFMGAKGTMTLNKK